MIQVMLARINPRGTNEATFPTWLDHAVKLLLALIIKPVDENTLVQ